MLPLLLSLLLSAQDAGNGADGGALPDEAWEDVDLVGRDGGPPWFLDQDPLVPPAWEEPWDGGPAATPAPGADAGGAEERKPPAAGSADGGAPAPLLLRTVRVKLDHPRSGEERRLAGYLGLRTGTPVTAETAAVAERRLLEMGVFRAVVCTVVPRGDPPAAADLRCGVSTARVIDGYRVEGLPALMLQRELEKRIFLRPGERLDTADPRTADRVQRQRRRVEEYLEQEGLFGARVEVLTPTLHKDPRSCEVVITIRGGRRVHIRYVEVRGAGPVSAQEVSTAVRGPPWQDFQPVKLRERMDKLQRRHRAERNHPEARLRFDYKVDLHKGVADVVATVEAGPYVDLRLDNQTPYPDADLLEQATFVESGSVDERECGESAVRIQRFLQERGHSGARVNCRRQARDRGHVRVQLTAIAGGRGFIRQVDIQGLRGLNPDVVMDQAGLASRARGWVLVEAVPPLWATPVVAGSKGLLLATDVAADVRRLEGYLASLGYTEAAVTPRVQADPGGAVVVTFVVEQGPRYVIQAVIFEGHQAFTAAELRHVTNAYPGGPFIPDALDGYRERILGAYARRGYLRTKVDILTDFDTEGRPVVKFLLQEGKRSTLKGIFLQGNQRTWDGVVRREFGVDEGEPMDPAKLAEGVGRLRRTGVFQRINARYLGVEEGREEIWAQIQVEERKTRTLDGAFSLSTADYLGVSMEARDRNLLGAMVDASVRAQFGPLLVPAVALPYVLPFTPVSLDPPQPAQDLLGSQVGIRSRSFLQLAVKVPRILGSAFNANLTGDAEIRDRPVATGLGTGALGLQAVPAWTAGPLGLPVLSARHREFDQERLAQFQLQAAGERPFLEWWRVQMGYAFDLYARQLATSPDRPWDLGLPTRSGALELQVRYTHLDNPFDPHQGVSVLGRSKLGARPLLAQGEYVVGSLQAEGYYTFWRVTLAGSLRTIAAVVDGGAGNKRIVPRRDLGIAGGDRSVRGYEEDAIHVERRTLRAGVSPLDPRSRVSDPGLYSGIVNLEARYSLWRNLGVGDLQAAAFLDSALVTDTVALKVVDLQHRPTEAGVGAGVGLRYVTPVGPVALDYGFDVLHPPLGRLHLLFGYTF